MLIFKRTSNTFNFTASFMRIKKLYYHYENLSILNFVRKLIYYFFNLISFSRLFLLIKAMFYFKSTNIRLGKNVRINGLPNKINIGNNCLIYDNCNFEFSDNSDIRIGANVIFSYGVVFCCNRKISIGNDVQIGEYTSLRDTTHRHEDIKVPIKYQGDISDPIIILDNVWIGRGCLIMPGAYINSGVIIGANSVVKGKLDENSIYAGSPAKLVKKRV